MGRKHNPLFPHKKKSVVLLIVILICGIVPLLFSQSDEPVTNELAPQTDSFWLWNFLGHLHPLAVHFPVGLFLFAAILELFTLKNFNSKLRPGINLLVIAGAISAVIAAVLGLLLARKGDYGKNTLAIHQWTGIGTAYLGVFALFFLMRAQKNKQPGPRKSISGDNIFYCYWGIGSGAFWSLANTWQ